MQAPFAKRSRRAVKLSPSLQRDLAAYALVAGAAGVAWLALAPPAEAQIVYTPTHVLLTKDGHMSIDLNNDGVTDVTIREILCASGEPTSINSLQAYPGSGAGFALGDGWIKAMSEGSIIGGQDSFDSGPAPMYAVSIYGAYYFGSWAHAGSKYLGIRFVIGSDLHYGWARIRATYEEHNHRIAALLTGYAYESKPNEPIRAGATGQSDEDSETAVKSQTHPPDKGTLGALARGMAPHAGRCLLD